MRAREPIDTEITPGEGRLGHHIDREGSVATSLPTIAWPIRRAWPVQQAGGRRPQIHGEKKER